MTLDVAGSEETRVLHSDGPRGRKHRTGTELSLPRQMAQTHLGTEGQQGRKPTRRHPGERGSPRNHREARLRDTGRVQLSKGLGRRCAVLRIAECLLLALKVSWGAQAGKHHAQIRAFGRSLWLCREQVGGEEGLEAAGP